MSERRRPCLRAASRRVGTTSECARGTMPASAGPRTRSSCRCRRRLPRPPRAAARKVPSAGRLIDHADTHDARRGSRCHGVLGAAGRRPGMCAADVYLALPGSSTCQLNCAAQQLRVEVDAPAVTGTSTLPASGVHELVRRTASSGVRDGQSSTSPASQDHWPSAPAARVHCQGLRVPVRAANRSSRAAMAGACCSHARRARRSATSSSSRPRRAHRWAPVASNRSSQRSVQMAATSSPSRVGRCAATP